MSQENTVVQPRAKMGQIKIVYDHTIFNMQRVGGISRCFYNLALAVDEHPDCRARIVAPLHDNAYLAAHRKKTTQKRVVWGIESPRALFHPRIRSGLIEYANTLALGFYAPDVYHRTYYGNSPQLKKRWRCSVTTIHDLIYEIYPGQLPWSDEAIAARKKDMALVDIVLCVSENTKKDLLHYHDIPAEKIRVVHHGCAALPVAEEKLQQVWRSQLKRPYLLFVGKRDFYKNFQCLVKAWRTSTRLYRELDLICFGGGELSRDEVQLFTDLSIPEERVLLVSGRDPYLQFLYANAAAFVYPSMYEGFGIPPLEAMHADCPVICSQVSSIPEIVSDAALYFDPMSPEDLRCQLERLLHDNLLATQLVLKGRARAAEFTWEKCARQTVACYRELI